MPVHRLMNAIMANAEGGNVVGFEDYGEELTPIYYRDVTCPGYRRRDFMVITNYESSHVLLEVAQEI